MTTNLKTLILLFTLLLSSSISFSQIQIKKWKHNDSITNHFFPRVSIPSSIAVENCINDFLIGKYLNQSESYRDKFHEFRVLEIENSKYAGISITYQHQFNTSPGLWDFTDYEYFDTRSGNYIDIMMLIDSTKLQSFVSLATQKKQNFLFNYKNNLSQTDENITRINEIIKTESSEPIKEPNIQKNITETSVVLCLLIMSYVYTLTT